MKQSRMHSNLVYLEIELLYQNLNAYGYIEGYDVETSNILGYKYHWWYLPNHQANVFHKLKYMHTLIINSWIINAYELEYDLLHYDVLVQNKIMSFYWMVSIYSLHDQWR